MKPSLVAGLVIIALAGCRQESPATARANFCEKLAEFQQALADVPPMEATTRVQDLRNAWQHVLREYRELQSDARSLDQARARQLERAARNLQSAMNDIPPNATVAEAATMMREPAEEYRAASQQMQASVQCPSTPTGQQ